MEEEEEEEKKGKYKRFKLCPQIFCQKKKQ